MEVFRLVMDFLPPRPLYFQVHNDKLPPDDLTCSCMGRPPT